MRKTTRKTNSAPDADGSVLIDVPITRKNKALTLPRLQQRLLLNRYLCEQFGVEDVQALRAKMGANQRQGYQADGYSYFYHSLETLENVVVPVDTLAAYDLRIKGDLERLNRMRSTPVQITYFQYLALLFTELFLEKRASDRPGQLNALNQIVARENADLPPTTARAESFLDADLDKIALWMATGSGKTLLMHVNIWQYQRHAPPEQKTAGVLLITPNEGLSKQQLEQFCASGIRAERFGEGGGGLFGREAPVTVIEITKLTDKSKGGGQSINVDEFESYGLILVDEGHRGASGEEWRKLRGRVAEGSFTIEYSATFGQIVNGAATAKRPALLEEYGKAILFDYSYPHFWEDGYGKDYCIVNLDDETEQYNRLIMLGNLLSYYEQALAYENYGEQFRPYNIDRPLWVFVGHSVTGKAKNEDDQETLTDVEQVIAFFQDFLSRPEHWTEQIHHALTGNTGVKTGVGDDLFQSLFGFVKSHAASPSQRYADILRLVFHAAPGAHLRAFEIKKGAGEIGLRVGADAPYFAVINVGDVSGLGALLEKVNGLSYESDVLSESLFQVVNAPSSPINVLIGSRKFMEGWDSFRVSSMGLMNIGRGEGSQIIQLFGRGVRLRGKGWSLKRTSATRQDDAPAHIGLLETLNIFGVRASYMAKFREYLQEEGIETDPQEIEIPIRLNDAFLERGLLAPRLPEVFDEIVTLQLEDAVSVSIDMRPRIESAQSAQSGMETEVQEKAEGESKADAIKALLPLLDWERITAALLEFKRLKDLPNLCFGTAALRAIATQGRYDVLCLDNQFPSHGPGGLRAVEDIAISVLKKYAVMVYDRKRRAWETRHMTIGKITRSDANLNIGKYVVKIGRQHKTLADELRALTEQGTRLYTQDDDVPKRIYFDRHLYQPLLIADKRYEGIAPAGLEPSEEKFVRDLQAYVQTQPNLLDGKEIFLLRNLSRGKGVGFNDADGEGFYPDFILWILEETIQRIVFIDPHGIRNDQLLDNPKFQLFRRLEGELGDALQTQVPETIIRLTSFILAPDSYESMRRAKTWVAGHSEAELEANHILFNQDERHVEKLFQGMFGDADLT